MLLVHRDSQDRISAVALCWLVDAEGRMTPDGNYVYVERVDVSAGEDGAAHLRAFIREGAERMPRAVGAYWYREGRHGEHVYGYRRAQLCQEVMG